MSVMNNAIQEAYRELYRNEENVKKTFHQLDYDHDECLSKDEFKSLLLNNRIYLNDQAFETFFSMNSKNGRVSYSNLYDLVNKNLQNSSFMETSIPNISRVEDSVLEPQQETRRTISRLGEMPNISNPYFNQYNHSRPQNISQIDNSYPESFQPFSSTIFRTGHNRFVNPKKDEPSSELSSLTRDLLNYDFRPNVNLVHKYVLITSPNPLQDELLHGIITNIQQELIHKAVLRHYSIYHVSDTSQENKYIITFIWSADLANGNARQTIELSLGQNVWKDLCLKYFNYYHIQCDKMIDIHPDYCKNQFSVY